MSRAIKMIYGTLIVAAAIGFMILVATAGNAQTANCAPADDMASILATRYGEGLLWIGLCGPAQCALYGNPDTQSWTLARVQDGVGCLMVAGVGYAAGEAVAPPVAALGEDG
jgi:hypothetical protein